jgi:hypothetical protein
VAGIALPAAEKYLMIWYSIFKVPGIYFSPHPVGSERGQSVATSSNFFKYFSIRVSFLLIVGHFTDCIFAISVTL